MTDRDAFEVRFGRALRTYMSEIPTDVDAPAIARSASAAHRPVLSWPWQSQAARAMAWIAVGVLLLTALVAAGLWFGSHVQRLTGSCPPGTDPNSPGRADQAKPATAYVQPMAFDRNAGLIVAHAEETWSFDVCSNTWRQERPTVEAPKVTSTLVYDVDADLTLGIAADHVWAYDLVANTWARKGPVPESMRFFARLVYDPVSGLVVAQPAGDDNEPLDMWTYAVETDSWTHVAAVGAPDRHKRQIIAYDNSADRVVVYDGEMPGTWLFDPRGGAWTTSSAVTPAMGFDWAVAGGEIAYDEATGQTIAFSGGKAIAYDAPADRWEVLQDPRAAGQVAGPTLIGRPTVVYDSFNKRLVVYGSEYPAAEGDWVQPSGVLAFDPATRKWTTLLASESIIETPGLE